MDAEPNDPARILIHDDQDPMGLQRCRLAPEQIHAPEAVFHVAQERQPGRITGGMSRLVVMAENPSNQDRKSTRLNSSHSSMTYARIGSEKITLLHFDDRKDE